jgi:hypothetical protein
MSDQEPDKQQEVLRRLQLTLREMLEQRARREGGEYVDLSELTLQELLGRLEQLNRPVDLDLPKRTLRELQERIERQEGDEKPIPRELLESVEFMILKALENVIKLEQVSSEHQAPISLYFDLDKFGPTDIADIIGLLSELYADIGGDGLVIDDVTLFEFQPAFIPVEV